MKHQTEKNTQQIVYRLVYIVEDDVLVVLVLAIDRREDMAAYHAAFARLLEKMR